MVLFGPIKIKCKKMFYLTNNTTIIIIFINFNLHKVETYRNTEPLNNYSGEIIVLFCVIILYLCV